MDERYAWMNISAKGTEAPQTQRGGGGNHLWILFFVSRLMSDKQITRLLQPKRGDVCFSSAAMLAPHTLAPITALPDDVLVLIFNEVHQPKYLIQALVSSFCPGHRINTILKQHPMRRSTDSAREYLIIIRPSAGAL